MIDSHISAFQIHINASHKLFKLGCRNQERAEAAKADLEEKTGKKDVFEILIIDVMDFNSVKNAVVNLSDPIDGMILNAGGPGGSEFCGMTKDGLINIMAVNVTGSALLVDEIIKSDKLVKGSTIIYASSEAARGVPSMGFPAPTIDSGSEEEFKEAIDGTKFLKLKDQSYETTYGFAKLVATLWNGSISRKFPDYRFIAVTPGMTTGTNIVNDLGYAKRIMFAMLVPVARMLGMSHETDVGAKRYLDAMYDFDTYKTGKFYGSIKGVTGEMGDQLPFFDALGNETFQDNAYEAIHSFLK